jgi:hypothetical protein
MRRRERFTNIAWLRSLETDGADGRVAVTNNPHGAAGASLAYLIHDLGGFVEMEKSLDAYHMRVLPRQLVAGDYSLPCGFSYSGLELRSILNVAVAEVAAVKHGRIAWRSGSKEHIRWVP